MKNVLWVVLFGVLVIIFIAIGLSRKGQGQEEIRIGVIPKETASVYWEGVRQGALKAAEEENIEVLWNGPEIETDREKQIQIIEDFVAQNVTGIVLAPNDRKALVPAVEKVYEKKIPCVIIDSDVETDKYLSFMATDNYQGGVLAAHRIGELLNNKGNVLLVKWIPNAASTDKRAQGFIETLEKEYPEIKIVDSKYPTPPTVAKVREITEDMLTRNTEVHGLFACNATTAAGALQALRSPGQAERGIKMVGFDAWDSLVEGLKSEEIDSLVIQNPYKMGYEGVKAILANLRGEEVPKQVDTGVELVTKSRLSEPKIRALLNLR
jgi:ribose transport system substrate-binding protein